MEFLIIQIFHSPVSFIRLVSNIILKHSISEHPNSVLIHCNTSVVFLKTLQTMKPCLLLRNPIVQTCHSLPG
jgi:hypothetical protein